MIRRRLATVVGTALATGALVGGFAVGGATALSGQGAHSASVPFDDPSTTLAPTVPLTAVTPTEGTPGTVVAVQGSECSSVAGHIEVFLATNANPVTRLAESDPIAEMGAPGDWSTDLQIPAAVAPGSDYFIGAQCWGDGFAQGHPGQQVEYFGYEPQAFTVMEPAVTTSSSSSTTTTTTIPPTSAPRSGYWMLGADGHVYPFGSARPFGNAPGPAVAIATRRDGHGYWVTDAAGNVRAFGTARVHGGPPALAAGEPVTSISATPSGNGYWLFTDLGRVFAYGDAQFHGDMRGTVLNGRIVASIATPSGGGYFMVGSDGGVFGFGDARFHGSTGGMRLNRPVVGIAATADNQGYWLVAADGGVFAFAATFRGSMGAVRLNRPVNGLVRYGDGYLMVASDGGIFDFSDRPFVGSLAADPPPAPIIGVAAFAS